MRDVERGVSFLYSFVTAIHTRLKLQLGGEVNYVFVGILKNSLNNKKKCYLWMHLQATQYVTSNISTLFSIKKFTL